MGWTSTFGRKLGAGFAIMVALTLLLAVGAGYALDVVKTEKDRVLMTDARNLILASKLHAVTERKSGAYRAFYLSGIESSLEDARDARALALDHIRALRTRTVTDEGRRLLDDVERAEVAHEAASVRVVELRRAGTDLETLSEVFATDLRPKMLALRALIDRFIDHEETLLAEGTRTSNEAARTASNTLFALALLVGVLAVVIGVFLTRTLTTQVGSAVRHVQSSAAELQAAATQQATGAREQAMAMNEISTTMSELLATSRQIAESSQRVSQIADETNVSARAGGTTVQLSQASFVAIKRQVDLVVTHMLHLGKKSQQIGNVLEIINELSEQTNILAINATIEAAGAGESGRRFAVVADEIRKLADRVSGSTKEIRILIDATRAAVNTTVMATEDGTKAVDLGARQFADVAVSLEKIASLVGTTMEAAREIELSTKQQTTAVSQVNIAISNVAQATKETEASSSQTLQTATELSALSRDLTRLIEPSRGT